MRQLCTGSKQDWQWAWRLIGNGRASSDVPQFQQTSVIRVFLLGGNYSIRDSLMRTLSQVRITRNIDIRTHSVGSDMQSRTPMQGMNQVKVNRFEIACWTRLE